LTLLCLFSPPPRPPPSSPLFPYTTLFRSRSRSGNGLAIAVILHVTGDEHARDGSQAAMLGEQVAVRVHFQPTFEDGGVRFVADRDRKSTRLNSSHVSISYAVFCLKKKKRK